MVPRIKTISSKNDGAYTEGDFTIAKFQFARIQRLFSGPMPPENVSVR
jgi:hypothetical protein